MNLSADAELMDQILRTGTVSLLMDVLRDEECSFQRTVVMLLVNLTQTPEGCDQVMQKSAVVGGAAVGMHFRRFIQMFVQQPVTPPPAHDAAQQQRSSSSTATVAAKGDPYEYIGEMLHNVSQLKEARELLTEPERGILPALLPQLRSASAVRRRGVAGMLRNVCVDAGASGERLPYLLGPAADVVTHLLFPLAGPDNYLPGEKSGMHPSLYSGGAHKARERDGLTRRWLVESLCGLAGTQLGREHLRRVRAYAIVKRFHEWLDESGRETVSSSSSSSVGEGADFSHVGSMDELDTTGDDRDEDAPMSVNDAATVAGIQRLVDQLFREDEVKHTYEVSGRRDHAPDAAAVEGGDDEFELPLGAGPSGGHIPPLTTRTPHARTSTAAAAAAAAPRPTLEQLQRQAPVPLHIAEGKAERIARTGAAGGVELEEEEVVSLVTPNLPDWTTE